MGQDVTANAYVHTKYLAEKFILQKVADQGLDAKIMRVGNLMSREEDGEFQSRLRDALACDDINAYVAPLVNYRLDDDEIRYELPSDNSFTIKALYRLGFQWSITEMSYLEAAIRMIGLLGAYSTLSR